MNPLAEQVGFQLTDLIWIHMGRQYLERLAGTLRWYRFQKVLTRVRAAVGDDGLRYIEKVGAWLSMRQETRTYKIDRLDSVQVQNLRYEVPIDFSLQDWLQKSFGVYRSGSNELQTIKIHFNRDVNRDVARDVQESRWHPSQQLTPQQDGSLVATFQLPDTTEIKRWIMSFGVNAKVVEPRELVDEIAKELHQMLNQYQFGKEATQ